MSNLVAVKPIYNDNDLDAALERLDVIFHAERGTREGDERQVLSVLIHAYERERDPLVADSPIETLRAHMDRLGLRPSDMIPYLGAQSRVTEVLGGKRKLTVEMIARLVRGIGIPAEDLLPRVDTPHLT